MYSEADCRLWQDQYFARDKTALDRLWFAFLYMGQSAIAKVERARGFHFAESRREEVIADAASYLIELYIRNPGWHVRKCFVNTMAGAVRKMVNDRKAVAWEMNTCAILDNAESSVAEAAPQLGDMIKELVYSHKQGNLVVLDLNRYARYADAVNAIAKYMPKPWIHNEAVRLNTVWRVLHWRSKK